MKVRESTTRLGAVARLRLAFSVLAFIALGTIVLSLQQLDSLRHSLGQLLGESIPSLIQAHGMEKQFVELLGLTGRMNGKLTSGHFDSLSRELVTKSAALRELVSQVNWTDSPADARSRTLEALKQFEQSTVAMRPLHANMLRAQVRLEQRRTGLNEFRQGFAASFEPLLIRDDLPVETASVLLPVGQQVIGIEHLSLHRFVARVNDVISSAEHLSSTLPAVLDQIDLQRLRAEMSLVDAVLARQQAGHLRADSVRYATDLKAIIFGPEGLIESLIEFERNSTALATAHNTQLTHFQNVTLLAESLEAGTSSIADVGRSLRHGFTIALATLAATGLASILVIAAVSYFVVERQINQRMSKLTRAVLAIARGDTAQVVDVQGSDELGEMARALDVFRENATELKRSNEELEKFAYAASHDLRSPLRAIENLACWTLEDAGDRLPAEARSNLEKLLSRVNRLSQLQTDLLDYSRAGKVEGDLALVDMRAMIDDLAELLDPDRRFPIALAGDITPMVTYVTPLRQILINLISNAIKHHDRKQGQLKLQLAQQGGRVYFDFCDDGPGIEPAYHDRIFALFQTLRPRDEVEGSGLGLSLIQKLVQRYGGSVRVCSDPAKARGSCFSFDLPLKDDLLAGQLILST